MLTSFLRIQYGVSDGHNTPKIQKWKDYRGVRGQSKRLAAIPAEEIVENTTVAETVEIDDPTNATLNEDPSNQSLWLRNMIAKETEPRPINSKPPRKEARQLHPFICSECGAKYKMRHNYIKHIREKHGLV